MRREIKLKVIDLFCGCGGMSLGFQKAGFDIAAAFDNWDVAIEAYRDNFKKHSVFQVDLSKLNGDFRELSLYAPDVIIGGPPCQDFSHAGKRDENLGRGYLTVVFANIIGKIKPQFFVMENVDQIEKTNKLKVAKRIFKLAGYGLTCKTLDASLCGVPQKRKRFFVIGEKDGADEALMPYLIRNLSRRPLTMKECFGSRLGINYYYRHPRNYNRRAIYSLNEPSPTIRGVNRPIPPNYPAHPLDATRDLGQVRPLTTQERSWIQTFPRNFKLKGTKSDVEQLIGNAVPVKMAEYVAKCLVQYITDDKPVRMPASLFPEPNYLEVYHAR
ncbi:MAG: DNA cytosine methyltransferase [Atribacterota bacterium]|nr:DNA cytosine methyltransferase [Atribacterota bacterium]